MAAVFQGVNSNLAATHGTNITKSDTAMIEPLTRGILIGTAGDLAVEYADGTAHIITGLAAGVIHPLQVRRILSTGTAASGISVYR